MNSAILRSDHGTQRILGFRAGKCDFEWETGDMVAMKITLSMAMRARDVSRPRDEHLAEAAEREKALARPASVMPAGPSGPAGENRKPAGDGGPGGAGVTDGGERVRSRRRRRRTS